MAYRTKTYIAADWSKDKDAVDQLHTWNGSDKWSLSFTDAHEITQARDSSLNCSIKSSLAKRLDSSKTFILVIGSQTKSLRSGGCQYCMDSYNSSKQNCNRGYSIDYRSYIEYECEKALRDGLKIVVLYKYAMVNRSKCPEVLKFEGIHVPMFYLKDGAHYWNYKAVKDALI